MIGHIPYLLAEKQTVAFSVSIHLLTMFSVTATAVQINLPNINVCDVMCTNLELQMIDDESFL